MGKKDTFRGSDRNTDPSATYYQMSGTLFAGAVKVRVTDTLVSIDRLEDQPDILVTAISGVSISGWGPKKQFQISHAGGLTVVEVVARQDGIEALRADILARVAKSRAPRDAPGPATPRPTVAQPASTATLGVPPNISFSDMDRARELLERDARTMAVAMLEYDDQAEAENDLREMADSLPMEEALAAVQAFRLLRQRPRSDRDDLLATAIPRAVNRLQQTAPDTWVRYLIRATERGFGPFSTTGINGRVVAISMVSLRTVLT